MLRLFLVFSIVLTLVGCATPRAVDLSLPVVGGVAPDFTLPAITMGEVTLSRELDRGPVVLVFYRGRW